MYGIIGFPLAHSFSPAFFTRKFKTLGIRETYRSFPLSHIEALPALLEDFPLLKGLNVTIPYKMSVLPYLHALSDAAREMGAVNCIRIDRGKLTGFNTDAPAFKETLRPLLKEHHRRALILGTGGAARAVAFALRQLGIPARFVSRTPAGPDMITYADLTEAVMAGHLLIVNATPLGMAPGHRSFPDIPYHLLTPQHILYDLIYNPERTLFLAKGHMQGATIQNGHAMLVAQAEASWNIWNGLRVGL